MSILGRARKFEEKTRKGIFRHARKLEEKIQQSLQGANIGEEPLEVWRGIAKEIEGKVQPVKGGYIFPHHQVAIAIRSSSSVKMAAMKAAFEVSRVEEDIRQVLLDCECEVPAELVVTLRFVSKPGPEWTNSVFHVKYVRLSEPVKTNVRRSATLRIIRGTSAQSTYVFETDVIHLGRSGPAATNDVVFEDSDDPINRTVSRKHAKIVYDQKSAAYVLYDQSSLRGSSIVRAGRSSKLPSGGRGRRLLPGDQIVLGSALIEFS